MSEPEDLLIEAAAATYSAAKKLWAPDAGPRMATPEHLSTHRRRLLFLAAALYDRDFPLRTAQPPAPPTMLRRLFRRPQRLNAGVALPATDGYAIFLPTRISWPELPAERIYRALMLLQIQKILRGTAIFAPAERLPRALFSLSEARASELAVRQTTPGFAADLDTLRAKMCAGGRPQNAWLRPIERYVEALYHGVLLPDAGQSEIPTFESAEVASQWAQKRAKQLRQNPAFEKAFRGLKPDAYLGLLRAPDARASPMSNPTESGEKIDREAQNAADLDRRPDTRNAREDEDEHGEGMWALPAEGGEESVEDPLGLNRPADPRAGQDVDDVAESLADLEEARIITTPEYAKEVFVTDDPPESHQAMTGHSRGIGIVYPEWDFRKRDYRHDGAHVCLQTAPEGDGYWAENVIRERRVLFDTVRRRFEGLRPRRIALGRQRDGEDIDIDAWVGAYADRQAGVPLDHELYRTTRPQRRDMAIQLVIDVSASTDAACTERLRIIDVEKEALLLCCHALQTLGDSYAIDAFSGESRTGVEIFSIKTFEERHSPQVYRRIAGLEPDNYTRTGAAVRHATASLSSRTESHRLLLLLSDGKPNDFDEYAGKYGIEDVRQAVLEAQANGIHVFCLTIDQNAPDYMARIFGPFNYTTLAHARELPTALVDVLKQLIQS